MVLCAALSLMSTVESAHGADSATTRTAIGSARVATYRVPGYGQIGAGHDAHRYWVLYWNPVRGSAYSITVATQGLLPSDMQIRLPNIPRPELGAPIMVRQGASVAGAVSGDDARAVLLSLVPIGLSDFLTMAASSSHIPLIAARHLSTGPSPLVISGLAGGNLSADWVLRFGSSGTETQLPRGRPLFDVLCRVDASHPKRAIVVVVAPRDSDEAAVYVDGQFRGMNSVLRDERLAHFSLIVLELERGPHRISVQANSKTINEFMLNRCLDG